MELRRAGQSSLWQRVEAFGVAHEMCGGGIEFADGHVLVIVQCVGCGAQEAFEGSAEGEALDEVGAFIEAIREWSALDQSSKH
jgi:hypothetical protein